jgi:hypothetical protein
LTHGALAWCAVIMIIIRARNVKKVAHFNGRFPTFGGSTDALQRAASDRLWSRTEMRTCTQRAQEIGFSRVDSDALRVKQAVLLELRVPVPRYSVTAPVQLRAVHDAMQ